VFPLKVFGARLLPERVRAHKQIKFAPALIKQKLDRAAPRFHHDRNAMSIGVSWSGSKSTNW